jgi:hypothetical protein
MPENVLGIFVDDKLLTFLKANKAFFKAYSLYARYALVLRRVYLSVHGDNVTASALLSTKALCSTLVSDFMYR